MRGGRAGLLVWAGLLGLGLPGWAAPPAVVVGVAPIAGQADAVRRQRATQILQDALSGLPGLSVVSLAGLDQLVGPGPAAALAACKNEDACVRAVAQRVRTDQLVIGELDPELTLRLRLIDSATTAAGPLVRVSRQVGASDSELRQAVTAAALELFPERVQGSFGTLELVGGQPGAAIFIDDEPQGELSMQAPPQAALRLQAGLHKVKVVAPGHSHFQASIDITVGQRSTVEVQQSKNRSNGPLYLVGGGAAAAGVALALGLAVQARANGWKDACATGMPCAADFTRARYESDDAFVQGGGAAATGLWVVAGAAIVGGIVWFIMDPGEDEVSP